MNEEISPLPCITPAVPPGLVQTLNLLIKWGPCDLAEHLISLLERLEFVHFFLRSMVRKTLSPFLHVQQKFVHQALNECHSEHGNDSNLRPAEVD